MGPAPLVLGDSRAASYQAEPEGLLEDAEGVPFSSGGGRERLELDRDKGGGAMLDGAGLEVAGSVVLAQRRGRAAALPGRAANGEPRGGTSGGTTASGAVSMFSVSSAGGGARVACRGGCGRAGSSGQSRLQAEWGSPQLEHLAGAAGQLVFVTGRGGAGFRFVTPPSLRPGLNTLPLLPAPPYTGPWPGCGAGQVFYLPR